jgi:hypothetical protein
MKAGFIKINRKDNRCDTAPICLKDNGHGYGLGILRRYATNSECWRILSKLGPSICLNADMIEKKK